MIRSVACVYAGGIQGLRLSHPNGSPPIQRNVYVASQSGCRVEHQPLFGRSAAPAVTTDAVREPVGSLMNYRVVRCRGYGVGVSRGGVGRG